MLNKKGTVKVNRQLKNRRDEMGLTQVQIADKAGVTERSYQRYEADERIPDVHTAQLIAHALNSTIEALFPLPERQFRKVEKEPDGNRAE